MPKKVGDMSFGEFVKWIKIKSGGGITTPASSTDNAIVRFDGTEGKTLQNSGCTIDDSNNATITGDLTVSGGKVTLTNGSTVDSESAGILLLTEDVVKTSAALRVGNNIIQASDGGSTITMDTSDNVTIAGNLTVNGTTTTISTTNLIIQDKIITLNDGGNSSSGGAVGIEIEENNAIVGYVKTNSGGDWTLHGATADGTAADAILTLDVNATKTLTVAGALNIEADSNINQDLSSDSTAATFATLTISTSLLPDASGGADIGSTSAEWGDFFMGDGKVIKFGADQDVTLTHVEDTGLLLAGTTHPYLQIRDSALVIGSSADGQLDIDADTELELTAPTLDIVATTAVTITTPSALIKDTTTSSATEGGALKLASDDGAVMASGHRLGVIEFAGAEDTGNTLTVGAKIEALCDATWSASENGASLLFYTTDGNASQSEVLKLDSNKLATFSGDLNLADDKKMIFGANNDASIEYDENGTDRLIISGSVAGIDISGSLYMNEIGPYGIPSGTVDGAGSYLGLNDSRQLVLTTLVHDTESDDADSIIAQQILGG